METYDHKTIDKKWQEAWEKDELYKAPQHPKKKPAFAKASAGKQYILDMFPYPSGAGLHVGHPEGYTATDILSRFMRMQGYDVLHPMGWDAFGLPAENYAIKQGVKPAQSTAQNINRFREQIKSIGLSYDWSREINTSDPEYYRWTQWLFIQFYKKGLAYKKEAYVNWCPKDQTVLANEQVVNGCCERCGTKVIQKSLSQWFLKITDYADRLLNDLENLDWPEPIKLMQKNWIGRSEGAEIDFEIETHPPTPSQREGEFGYHTTDPKTWAALHERVLEMRKIPTQAEEVLWQSLRKNLIGCHFRRQHIIGRFIVDFVCLEKTIVVEVDGDIHDYQKKEDEDRTKFLIERGFKVIRYRNDQVIKDMHSVVEDIKKEISSLPFGEGRGGVIKVFTTRPDTLFGATYMVLAPEHPLVEQITTAEQKNYVINYVIKTKEKTELQRTALEKEKTGVFTGAYAINPATKEKIPVWIADYVLMNYGTGAIMAVPAHDERDFAFAKKYNLPIRFVVTPPATEDGNNEKEIYTGYGYLQSSEKYNGLSSEEAKKKIAKDFGHPKIQYKLRDWLVSRQRYWGAPIPIIYCEKCGMQAVLEEDLPVKLPTDVDFLPTGESPIARSKTFHKVKCPKCGEPAKRDSDTMDTFVDSSWYFFRFTDPHNDRAFADKKNMKEWLPVDTYVGGAEHAVLHLLYARFFTKALADLKYINFEEPFTKLHNQGLILGPDGEKMSKSRGNVINPDDVIAQFGADAFRMYEMFMGPLEEAKPWQTNGIVGVKRFLDRVWRTEPKGESESLTIHKLIKKITSDIENFKFNTAIAAFMEFLNENKQMSQKDWETFLILLAPFAPHITEELWHQLGHKDSIHKQAWPKFDEKLTKEDTVTVVVQVLGRVRATLEMKAGSGKSEVVARALADANVKKHLEGKEIVKEIFVQDKLINFAVKA